jgi:ubiquinone/menaquinone biosynthesis C-methylase UbiE
MLLEMESTGYEIVGIDLSERMGRLALARLKRSGKKIPMIRGRAESLPFASSHFDTILTTFPAEFIVARKTIASSYEVLKPGGRMVIVLEAHFTGGGPLHRSIEFLYAITGQRQSPGQSSGSSPYWTAITNRFTDQGYQLLHERVKLRDSQVIVIIAEKPPQTAMD